MIGFDKHYYYQLSLCF